jgi:chemotaxis protein CheC
MMSEQDFLDALAELVNIGVGRAASSLNAMVGEHIDLSVPHIEVVAPHELAARLAFAPELPLAMVDQPFQGRIEGMAALIFPLDSARNLVSLLTGGTLSAEELDVEREAALGEIGNILINGVMGSIGNLTGQDIRFGLPQYLEGRASELPEGPFREEGTLMVAKVLFRIARQNIQGHLVLLFELRSIEHLRDVVQRLSEG